MKNFLFPLLLICAGKASSQYYFNDIIGAQETTRLMKAYIQAKVRTVSATGFDQKNVRATDFSEFHEVKEGGAVLKITTHTSNSHSVVYHRFDASGRLISTIDSSAIQKSETRYQYDANGRYSVISNSVKDSANDFNQTETHTWIYNANGKPQKMWRVITGSENTVPDTLEVRFNPDDEGNAGEEKTFRKNVETGSLYYYYDDKARLTDVVRYNTRLKKLIPDYMFEYDDNDRVIQKITTTASLTAGYFIWRYLFDAKGLKTKEALFNNDKQLTGKIEYSYTFNQ